MARTARASVGNVCYHVLNRGNGGIKVFRKSADYDAFIEMLIQAGRRLPMRVLGFCLMPNHFHLLLWPCNDGDLSSWMQWVMTVHVRRYHRHYQSSGHIWQGRFKAFPIQRNAYFYTALRYVERNALRAQLVDRAERWVWGSLYYRQNQDGRKSESLLSQPPIVLPQDWVELVNKPMHQKELDAFRLSINRNRPFGAETWQSRIAKKLGLEAALNPRGRPKKEAKK